MKRYVLLLAFLGESLCASEGKPPLSPDSFDQSFSWLTPSKQATFNAFVGRGQTESPKPDTQKRGKKSGKKSNRRGEEHMLSTPHKNKEALHRKRQDVVARWHAIEMNLRQDILEATIKGLIDDNETHFHPNLSLLVDSQDENGLTLLHRLVINGRIKTPRDSLYTYFVRDLRAKVTIGPLVGGVVDHSKTVAGILEKKEPVSSHSDEHLVSSQFIAEPQIVSPEELLRSEKTVYSDDDVPSQEDDFSSDLPDHVSPFIQRADGSLNLSHANTPLEFTPQKGDSPVVLGTKTSFGGISYSPQAGTPPAGGSPKKPQEKSSPKQSPLDSSKSPKSTQASKVGAYSSQEESFITTKRSLLVVATAGLCLMLYRHSTFAQPTSNDSLGFAAQAA